VPSPPRRGLSSGIQEGTCRRKRWNALPSSF